MKKSFIILIMVFTYFGVYSQTTEAETLLSKQTVDTTDGWEFGGNVSLNLSQVSLSNWAAGGQSSIAINGLVNLNASYKKNKHLLENFFILGYGSMKQGKDVSWWKTDDKIDFTSKYGYKMKEHLYMAGLVNFKTQMDAGYNYPNDSIMVSKFMAPGYFLGAIGLDYKPNPKFGAFISPITLKYTIVLDQDLANEGAFGVVGAEYDGNILLKEGENLRSEFGGYLRAFYKQTLMKNIDLATKLELFSNYANNPQNIDVNWEVLLSMKVNSFVTASISTTLIYDDDINIEYGTDDAGNPLTGPRTQFKEVLQVGVTYSF